MSEGVESRFGWLLMGSDLFLHTEGVTGSNPVLSILFLPRSPRFFLTGTQTD